MEEAFLLVALGLLGTVGAGFVRIVRGPTDADRMLVAQLFGTTGVAILLLISVAAGAPAATDVALVFAVLAAVLGVAFSTRRRRRGHERGRRAAR